MMILASVADPDPYWIGSVLDPYLGACRIRIRNTDPDPDPHMQI